MPELQSFAGRWRFAREIEDHAAGQRYAVRGIATFAPDGAGLVYDEAGELVLPTGGTLRAERRYLWRAGAGGIEVMFEDGRFFHRIMEGARNEDIHLCDPDRYEGAYDFTDWPAWRARWRVAGPRKDYLMQTRYAPLEGETP